MSVRFDNKYKYSIDLGMSGKQSRLDCKSKWVALQKKSEVQQQLRLRRRNGAGSNKIA
jgi:hypothetical protein